MTSNDYSKHVLSCRAGYGNGGLGQHFSYVVEQAAGTGVPVIYFTRELREEDPRCYALVDRLTPMMLCWTPLRWSPGGADYFGNDRFDRAVAKYLRAPLASFTGFGGQSLRSFGRARKLGCGKLRLLAANSHVNNVRRRHREAMARWPLESSWLNDAQCEKTLAEYEMADEILIASEYSWQTFVAEGVAESKLRRVRYPVAPRFNCASQRAVPRDGVFRIVCIGSVTIFKGVPLLLEAFARLKHPNAQLILVGATATRGMRRYMEEWLRRDSRIQLAPGDPLPHLLSANACVHPSFEDNLAYACIEAMACGTPLIVSSHTGAKEYVRESEHGWILPTGNLDALTERLQALADTAN
jgi:glycosyltransferase involved in cell wall biosynthesis